MLPHFTNEHKRSSNSPEHIQPVSARSELVTLIVWVLNYCNGGLTISFKELIEQHIEENNRKLLLNRNLLPCGTVPAFEHALSPTQTAKPENK